MDALQVVIFKHAVKIAVVMATQCLLSMIRARRLAAME